MLNDIAFTKNVIKFVPPERLFSEAHKYLYERVKDKFEKKGELITYIEIEDHLKGVDKIKRRMLKAFCKRIYSIHVGSPAFLKEKLTEYSKKNAFIDVFMTAQAFWNSKAHDKAFQYTMEGINHLYGISFFDDATIPLEKFEEMRQLYVSSSYIKNRRIPTNIGSLDDILRGGLEKGELAIALAAPKKGKSICLTHMGCMALMTHAGRVAHFVLEGTTEQSMLRYMSRLTGIPYRRLEMDEISKEESKKIAFIEKKYMGKLDLIPFNQHWDYTVIDVESKLKELESIGRKPDLVVIDYADLLKTEDKKMEKRFEQTEVYRDLKRLAVMKKYAIWTASQANRGKEEPEETYLMRARDISESYEKVRIADLVLTLNQTPKEKENGLLRFHLDIYRSNESDQTFTLIVDFERMIFHSKLFGEAKFEMDYFEWMKKRKRKR